MTALLLYIIEWSIKMSFRYRVLERCIKAIDIKKIYSLPENEMFQYLKNNHRAYDLPDFLYKRFDVDKINMGKQLLFKMQPKNGISSNVILFIHGGGGMMCPTLLHYRFAERLVKNTGAVLYFPFYPLGPEASINESLLYLDKVYEEILKKHNARDITIVGDSAGAALAVSVCRRSSEKPKGLVLISPSVGINKNDGMMKTMEDRDVMLSMRTIELVKKYWIRDTDIENADYNTLKDDYKGFPPIQLYYGTSELFYVYINELIDKIKSSGVKIETFEGKNLCHDWVIIGVVPEGREAVKKICKFIET